MENPDGPNFDEQFEEAVAEWRERHRLREDDAVLLLVELFRIHQQHWDTLRRREFPSLEEFHPAIAKLSEASRTFQQQATKLIEELQRRPAIDNRSGVSHTAAFLAAIAAGVVGYLIGRAWL
jgi:hypothetical protein